MLIENTFGKNVVNVILRNISSLDVSSKYIMVGQRHDRVAAKSSNFKGVCAITRKKKIKVKCIYNIIASCFYTLKLHHIVVEKNW